MPSSKKTMMLPSSFAPGDKDVIVGRGKVCYKHSGNQRLNKIVQSVLDTYSDPDATKKSKSELIKSIMNQVREGSPDGGFVKFDTEVGHWFEVGDRIAREKVSQTFRDALNDKYKSSTTSKTLKRRQERINKHTSVGSKDGSSGLHSPHPVDCNGIPEAQARVDSLLLAAGVAGKPMLPPGINALPHGQAFMSPFMMQRGLLPGHAMMGAPPSMAHMNPSLHNYMTANIGHQNYSAMMRNNGFAQQAQLGPSLMGSANSQQRKLEP